MLDKFKVSSGNARASLKELKSLTDEQIKVYKATTNDQQAINVANSTYYTWEAAVDGLSSDPIDDAKFAALDEKIQNESSKGVTDADAQAKSITAEDVDQEDKTVIENEILTSGGNVQTGMQDVMKEMQAIIQELTKLVGGGSNSPLGMIAKIAGVKAPAIDASILQAIQGVFSVMTERNNLFSGAFGNLMQSTSALVGK